jgi:hypothetical protein
MIDLSGTATRNRILQMTDYYGLKPKKVSSKVRINNYDTAQAWTVNKCTVNFYDSSDKTRPNFIGFSYDGQPKASYQLALNILCDLSLQKQMGIIL